VLGIINCVGLAHFSRFDSVDNTTIHKIHNTNIGSLHFMLKLSNLLKKNAIIAEENPFFINVSSSVAKNPYKYSAVYSATKAYLSNLIEVYSKEN
jgi:short-subunit dehydrogenase